MSETGALGAGRIFALPSRADLVALTRRSDLVLAVSVLGILVVLIFPLPALLLDLLLAVSITPVLVYLVLRQFAEAMGRPWVPMFIMLAGVGLNALLNWIFIYGHLGAPALGLTGAAISTLISRSIGETCGAAALPAARDAPSATCSKPIRRSLVWRWRWRSLARLAATPPRLRSSPASVRLHRRAACSCARAASRIATGAAHRQG